MNIQTQRNKTEEALLGDSRYHLENKDQYKGKRIAESNVFYKGHFEIKDIQYLNLQ